MKTPLYTFILLSFFSFSSIAQEVVLVNSLTTNETPTTEATNEEEETSEEKSFSISGFADGYYMYNFNETSFPTSFTDMHNQFSLGMANIVLAKEGKVGFVADLAFGPRAEAANGQFFSGDTQLATLSAIKQLYVTYSPTDAITLTYGTFSTFVGYELIDAPGNVNYSTSYLFSNGPFYHTGLKADFAFGENFGAMVGIFNDTDNKFDIVPGKHFGAQLSASVGNLGAYLNFIGGKEEELGANDQTGFEVDLTATYEVSDKLMIGLNIADKSSSIDGKNVGGFTGAAVYSTIGLTDNASLGLRAEYFDIKSGDDSIDNNNVVSITASGNITLGESLTFIPEFRFDFSNNEAFFEKFEDGAFSEFSDGNGAFILAAVYSF